MTQPDPPTPEEIDQLRDRIAEAIEPWFNYFAPGSDPQPTHRERLVGAANAVMELIAAAAPTKENP